VSQQTHDQSVRDPAEPAAPPTSAGPTPLDLPSLTVRALVTALGEAEDVLRGLEPFVVQHGRLVVNPARAPWITRERALVAELRSRHTSWRRGALHAPAATRPD
jgi:hypothetical protein